MEASANGARGKGPAQAAPSALTWRPQTWVKPSFAWMLYRSGYGRKPGQEAVLKIKLPHSALARLLDRCDCRRGGGGGAGRVQWDPERDLMQGDGARNPRAVLPRKMLRRRSVQLGLSGELSAQYVASILSVADVTELAHRVWAAHAAGTPEAMAAVAPALPHEREYTPRCGAEALTRLGMLPGETADWISAHGRGLAHEG